LIAFWSNLKQGYDQFEKRHLASRIKIRGDGTYELIDEFASRDKR